MNVNAQTSVAEATINITTTYEIKNTLAHAAALYQQSITTFLLEAAFEQAKRVLQEHETITLSNAERDRFFALLETSDEPNDSLKAAMSEYLEER
jgi:uncharacterized protein (DUF1778 family)